MILRTRSMVRVLVVVSMFAGLMAGQSVPPSSAASQSNSKHEKVVELLKLSRGIDTAMKIMHQSMETQKHQLPIPPKAQDDFVQMFYAEITPEALTNLIVPEYEQAFTESELDQIIAFYKTPIGQKLLEKTPALLQALSVKGRELGMQAGQKIGAEIERRLKAGDYGPWPPTDKTPPPTQQNQDK